MEWTWLIVLICPIMMLFMMKYMHGKHQQGTKPEDNELNELRQQVKELNLKVDELNEANTN
ncbi:DUF2933 domain-containing protein [Cohnella phaseoli]|uniref:DUF2933 family protein n=1 Tax=Cohnella phaseoli TaxID=456490 RepID=A0A3D9JPX0_9BACL|nr:DUF2933 domain-containing protein [Cohnella phaseoli]RED76074.1 DUF2933 family protein [Cohnella phaseoli]